MNGTVLLLVLLALLYFKLYTQGRPKKSYDIMQGDYHFPAKQKTRHHIHHRAFCLCFFLPLTSLDTVLGRSIRASLSRVKTMNLSATKYWA